MPLLEISTNTKIEDTEAFLKQASQLTSRILGKPESYVMVRVQQEQTLFFSGNSDPAAHVKLKSLGLPEDNTAVYSSQLCLFINEKLNISSARIYIEFSSPARHLWGWDERTF